MLEKTNKDMDLIEALYEAALNPQNFNQLTTAWDQTLDDFGGPESAYQSLVELQKQGLARHFERAGQIFSATATGERKSPIDFINAQRTAATLTNLSGRILALNDLAKLAFGLSESDKIFDLPLESESEARLRKAIRSLSKASDQHDQAIALSGVRQDNDKVFVVVIERLTEKEFQAIDEPTLLFRSTLTQWDERIRSLLQTAFGLTPAELEIIKLLNEGLKADEIAEKRRRSLKTVRTQIKTINQKTRTSSQTELMRHVSSLIIMAGEIKDTISPFAQKSSQDKSIHQGTLSISSDGLIHYIGRGPKNGRPILNFCPTLHPLNNLSYESEIAELGYRPISVFKPGAGKSTSAKHPLRPIDQARNFTLVSEALKLDRSIILGYCSGVVPALNYAINNPDRSHAIILIDSGAPLRQRHQWGNMSASAKRTFFLAKHAPALLRIPHQLVAGDFFSGEAGCQRTIEYFYKGQGQDISLLREPARYEWAKQMIGYCLSDTQQLISDVSAWASDWSELAIEVSKICPIVFIHGDENGQFPIKDLHQFTEENENMQLVVAKGAAQLTLLTHQDLIIETITSL